MLKAGADLILGGHTHCVQPIINSKGKSIVYSMGNFLFPDRLICPPRSTYYPHPLIDIDKLPITDAYPYVDEITFKIWKPMARVGMIITATIKGYTVISEAKYTLLTRDNIVQIKELPNDVRKKLNIISKMLKCGMYPQIIFVVRCLKFIFNLPRRIIRKIRTVFKYQ